MPSIRDTLGNDSQLYEDIIKKVGFNLRCCVPGIIQSYDSIHNTASIQPAIREEIVNDNNMVQYVNLPLLVNVPILFPSCSIGSIKFLLSQGDECLVFFSDLSYDNFWQKGNIQNPIEVRRHDLSDGLAIPCIISQPKTDSLSSGMEITYGSSKIKIDRNEITFTDVNGSITLSQIIRLLNHYHTAPAAGGNTSAPKY